MAHGCAHPFTCGVKEMHVWLPHHDRMMSTWTGLFVSGVLLQGALRFPAVNGVWLLRGQYGARPPRGYI